MGPYFIPWGASSFNKHSSHCFCCHIWNECIKLLLSCEENTVRKGAWWSQQAGTRASGRAVTQCWWDIVSHSSLEMPQLTGGARAENDIEYIPVSLPQPPPGSSPSSGVAGGGSGLLKWPEHGCLTQCHRWVRPTFRPRLFLFSWLGECFQSDLWGHNGVRFSPSVIG